MLERQQPSTALIDEPPLMLSSERLLTEPLEDLAHRQPDGAPPTGNCDKHLVKTGERTGQPGYHLSLRPCIDAAVVQSCHRKISTVTAIGLALEFLSRWFTDHTTLAILVVGVVVGTFAITLRMDHDR